MDFDAVQKGLDEIKIAVSEKAKALHEELRKSLEAERATNDELLKGKASNEAVSALQENLGRIEKSVEETQKALDDEIAQLKMGARAASTTEFDEEIKSSFFNVLQYGNGAGLSEGEKNRLAEVLAKQSELSEKPLSVERIKAMISGIDTAGGLLVLPPVLERDVLKFVSDGAALYEMAGKTTISGPVYQRNARITRAGSSWEGETDPWPQTPTPNYGRVEIPVHKIISYPSVSRDLIEDSGLNIESEVMDFVRESFRDRIGEASVLGDGKRKPYGILSYPTEAQKKAVDTWGKIGYVVTGNGSGLHADNPTDALIDLQNIVKTSYLSNAVWLMNRTTGAVIRKLKDKDGNYLWQPSLQAGVPSTLLGYPVRYDVNMPDIEANKFPVAFGNFNQALLVVNRRGMTVIRDMTTVPGHVRFLIDLRLGMGIRNFEAIKLLKVAAS